MIVFVFSCCVLRIRPHAPDPYFWQQTNFEVKTEQHEFFCILHSELSILKYKSCIVNCELCIMNCIVICELRIINYFYCPLIKFLS